MLKKYLFKNKIKSKNFLRFVSYLAGGAIATSTLIIAMPTHQEITNIIETNEISSIEFSLPEIKADNEGEIKSKLLNLTLDTQDKFCFDSITYDPETIPLIENISEEEFLNAVLASESYIEEEKALTLETSSIIEKMTQPVYYEKETPKIKKTSKKTIVIPKYTAEQIAANALTPYLAPVNDNEKTYNFDNMIDAPAASSVSDKIKDTDLEYLARIIHCESNFGYDSRRAVGTVVVNRMLSPLFPDTIFGVISQPNQFSPYSSGKFWSCTPNDDDYAAAYDVLYNNYRSFPYYVYYFQSICDGYFSGQNTYITYYIGNYKQYFSYNTKDIK